MTIFWKLAVGFLAVLIIFQIWVSHQTASQGTTLKKIEDLQRSISQENLELETAIASASALRNIASQSAGLGLFPPKALQYLR